MEKIDYSLYLKFADGSRFAMLYASSSFDDAKAHGLHVANLLYQGDGDRFKIEWYKVQPVNGSLEVVI
jgi:hypothetical protein